ncbi:uncharacterized protein LOC132841178 isoform X1 [Tachysurus vachellii]|uniref:uncharacterized protein LOC132841178 isoform X1 n=1 Tax=Tachysurus vachellii TaxID=175792 RepID=UPI00296AACFE|nr:uncharacterized protein LOC132841178 isoform X1 [Tachysurus vachellii]XP_060719414.1 uncharacterized protein LOC132841178 isoform X1 [Tachysurus vachellii]
MTDIFVGNKVFVLVTGKTLNVDKKFMEHLKQQKPDLQEVKNVAECDYVLVFCPIVSRAGTDIEAALKNLQDIAGSKPAVLVMLHHTFDKDYVVPDSSRAVKRKNLLTVDCLFYEDQGLLQCTKNAESLGKILSIIKPEASWWSYFWFSSPARNQTNNMEIGPSKTESDMTSEIQNAPQIIRNSDVQNEQKASDGTLAASADDMEEEPEKMTDIFLGNKLFVLVTGNTLNVDKKFMEHLKQQKTDLQEVKNVAECDYVLVFCPIVSRAGTDIEAALKNLQDIAGSKPAVLVVLHHTFDKDYVAPDSSRAVKRKNSLTVDCLFHEDQGLLQCTKNDESLGKILSIIKEGLWWNFSWPWSWWTSDGSKDQSQSKDTETNEKDSVQRILVLGRNDAWKSSSKTIILGRDEMNQASVAEFTATQENESMEEEVAGRKVTVVETPNIFSAELAQEKIRKDVEEAINLSKPGPHAFLLIIPVNLSEDNKVMVQNLKVTFLKMEEIFGERFWKHTMIIFSVSNEYLKKKIMEFIQSGDQEVQTLVQKCEYKYDFLTTKDNEVGPQDLKYLLEKIEKIKEGEVKDFYSSEVYLKTLASIGGSEKKINNELEDEDDPANELMRNIEKIKEETKRHGKAEQEETEQSPKEPKIVEELKGKMVI